MDFVAELAGDVGRALHRRNHDDSQAARRDLVRTLFAAIEGVSWMFKEHVADALRQMDSLSPEEEIALSEDFHFVNDNGKITTQRRHLSTPATIKLAARLAKRADPNLNIDLGSEGWSKLRDAVSVRNRITHPKRPADMSLGDDEVSSCLVAFYWLLEVATDAMEASIGAMRVHTRVARELLAELQAGDARAWQEYRAVSKALSNTD
jgi:hypothetical protein